MKIASWNVNGIRAVVRKGINPCAVVDGIDVLGVQETKARPEQVTPDVAEPDGWYTHWFPAERPGYSGVAMFSREKPDECIDGLGDPDYDVEGRVQAMRFGDLVVVNAYFPNSQEGGARIAYKVGFCAAMEKFLAKWRRKRCRTVLIGDYNIAHRPIDLARPEANEANPGYLPEERDWFARYMALGYRDVWRDRNPERAGIYSWWSYRYGARAKNLGWRIDYATVSPGLEDRVVDADIHTDVQGSDHCPVSVELS